jgi:recombination protein RecT
MSNTATAERPAATKPAAAPGTLAKPDPRRWMIPTNKAGLDQLAPLVTNEIARGLPGFMRGNAERLIRAMITETTKNPALLECTPASLFGGVIQAAQLGLTIGATLGEAYLIPFNNTKLGCKEATLIVGYRGFIQLAHRSQQLRRLTPGIVRQGDAFTFTRGLTQNLSHEPRRNNREPVTDYYVCVELVNGGRDFETFTYEDAIEWRDRFSTTRNAPQFVRDKSPWYDMNHGFHQQACKTLIRKIAKRLPLSPELTIAAALEDAAEAGIPQVLTANLIEVMDNEPIEPVQSKAEELQGRLDKTKRPGKPDTSTSPPPPPAAEDTGELPRKKKDAPAQEHIPGIDDPANDPK